MDLVDFRNIKSLKKNNKNNLICYNSVIFDNKLHQMLQITQKNQSWLFDAAIARRLNIAVLW